MNKDSFSYERKAYDSVIITESNDSSVNSDIEDKKKCYILQQIFLIILIITCIIILILYISLYKSNQKQKKRFSSLNEKQRQELISKDDLISSLKTESQTIKSKISKIENLLQLEKQKQKINNSSLLINKNKNEFAKLLTSIYELKEKVQKPKTFTEIGLLINFLTAPRKVIGKNKIRVGNNGNGGYVLLDDFKDIKIAYSLGIEYMIEFDKSLADRNIDVYMYDHTINGLLYYNKKFHWFKKGLCASYNRQINLMTLTEMLKQNGHLNETNMILKIDVEGAEWEAFNELSEEFLSKFKYIVGEFHSFKDMIMRERRSELIFNVFRKLNKTHQVFHKHCHATFDAFLLGEYYFSETMELSYVRRDENKFDNDYSIYPIDGLDFDDYPWTTSKQIFLGMEGLFGFE